MHIVLTSAGDKRFGMRIDFIFRVETGIRVYDQPVVSSGNSAVGIELDGDP